ncbi:hypothetical protein ONZ45_g14417 [Pleurotus djamor]|nr:hypothetical protein ONZ45_g14417 [Pleurotus djamor]
MCIAYSHISFMRALKAQGKSRDSLPYKAPFQPWGSWFALIVTGIITFFKGFDTFIPFTKDNFVTSYIAIPVFFFLWIGYKFTFKTKVIPAQHVDLVSGLAQIDEEEEKYLAQEKAKGERTGWRKMWDSFHDRTWGLGFMYKSIYASASALIAILAYASYSYYFQGQNNFTTPITANEPAMSSRIASSVSRRVIKKVLAVETPEGDGALVRRSIGTPNLRNLSPFLMLDHFHVKPGAGFPDHPHRGQATVTYMLEGSSRHEDSAGHKGTIEPGGVQWMCAGRGIIHAEMPVHEAGSPDPRGMQLWVDLPKQYKMVEPSYQELGPEQIPTAYPEGPEGGVKIKVISGKSYGIESPVRPLGGCWYFHVIFDKKGPSIFQEIPAGWTAFIYGFKGSVLVGEETIPQDAFHTLVLSSDGEQNGVKLSAAEDGTEFVLVAGEPLDQPVFQYGPFVMTNREEIQKTLLDYQMGLNGFEKAHTWKSEIGNVKRR